MEVYKRYLHDLGVMIKEMALEAKQAARIEDSDFAIGYMAGFHRVVSLMQQQAEAFGIPFEDLGVDGIDPDAELV
jgi:hypothetical protein